MINNLTFILKLQDMFSPGLRHAAQISNTASNQIQSQFAAIGTGGKRMGASVDELRARLDAINKVRFSTTIEKEFNIATRAAKRMENQLEKLENKGSKKSGGGMLGSIVGGNLISGAISGGIAMVKDFAVDTYKTSLKNNGLKTAINSTTGGQGAAAIEQTSALADKYGLNYEASLEGIKTLTGGLKSMNMPLAEQMKIFEGVSTGVAAMKLGAEESKGAMLALGQMASKGTVSAEELRGQLGERIPGAFGIAAKAMNVTEKELGKMMQQGDLAAKDFLPRLAAEMQKTFGADALAAANGPAAIQQRFNNAIFKMKAGIGDQLMPMITPILQKFTELATTILPYVQTGIDFISTTVKEVWAIVSGITAGSGEWGSYIDVIKGHWIHVWATAQSLFKNIWAIVSVVVNWMGKSELLKDVFWAIGKIAGGILDVVSWIGDKIQWVWENIIKPILDVVDVFYSSTKNLFTGGKATLEVIDHSGKVIPITTGVSGNQPYLSNASIFNQFGGAAAPAAAVNPLNLNADRSSKLASKDLGNSGDGGTSGKDKASSINSGGQRSIVINISKVMDKVEQHIVGGGREAADEFASAVRQALQRELYSLNGVAS